MNIGETCLEKRLNPPGLKLLPQSRPPICPTLQQQAPHCPEAFRRTLGGGCHGDRALVRHWHAFKTIQVVFFSDVKASVNYALKCTGFLSSDERNWVLLRTLTRRDYLSSAGWFMAFCTRRAAIFSPSPPLIYLPPTTAAVVKGGDGVEKHADNHFSRSSVWLSGCRQSR